MTQNNKKHNPFVPLDAEEAKLMSEIENNPDWQPSKKAKETIKMLQKAAVYATRKSQPISIRLRNPVLAELKHRASQSGVPYQTIISALTEQYTQGKLKLKV